MAKSNEAVTLKKNAWYYMSDWSPRYDVNGVELLMSDDWVIKNKVEKCNVVIYSIDEIDFSKIENLAQKYRMYNDNNEVEVFDVKIID